MTENEVFSVRVYNFRCGATGMEGANLRVEEYKRPLINSTEIFLTTDQFIPWSEVERLHKSLHNLTVPNGFKRLT